MPSFAADGKKKENDAVTFSDTDQFLFENLRSFYRKECEEEMAKIGREASSQSESPGFIEPSRRSARLFVASGSSSPLIMDEACSFSASPIGDSSTAEEAEEIGANNSSVQDDDYIAILTYSRSPYEDFRRSMQEMVEARLKHKRELDRKFMEELLFRYLDLNNEKSYRYILRAFLDLIVVVREDSGMIPARRRPWNGGGGRRRKLKLEIKFMHKFCHK